MKEELNLTISTFNLKVILIGKSTSKLEIHILVNAINNHLRYFKKYRNNYEYIEYGGAFFGIENWKGKIENDCLVIGIFADRFFIFDNYKQPLYFTTDDLKSVFTSATINHPLLKNSQHLFISYSIHPVKFIRAYFTEHTDLKIDVSGWLR